MSALMDMMRDAVNGPTIADDVADEQEPQEQTDPGAELKRLRQQYGAPSRGGSDSVDPGAALKRLANEVRSQPGDVDLREPGDHAAPAPKGPSITTLEGMFHGKMAPATPAPSSDTSAVSVRVPENTQPNGLPQLARRNNNPGNLRFAGQRGAEEGDSGFAKFPTAEDGYRALLDQIDVDTSRGHTLTSFISKFAPPSENDTATYIAKVANSLGVSPDVALASLDKRKLARAIVQHESGSSVAEAPATSAVPKPFSADTHPEESDAARGISHRPIGALAATDATRVGAEPSAHYQPGLLERAATFPLAMATGAAEHPVDFAMAPVKAAITANRAAAEQDAENAIAMSGGPIGSVERTVSPRDAAIASAQLGAMALGPEAGELGEAVGSAAGKAIGGAAAEIAPTVGHIAGHLAGAGAAGAAFTPDDPVAGALGMMLMALPYPAIADAGSRALDAGRTRVAGVIDQVRQANEAARTQATAEGRAEAQQSIMRAIASLDPKDLTYISRDPILGPIARQAQQRTGVTTPLSETLASRLSDTPQTEPDVPLADAIRSQPRTRDVFPGSERVSTEPAPDNGTVVPLSPIATIRQAMEDANRVASKIAPEGGADERGKPLWEPSRGGSENPGQVPNLAPTSPSSAERPGAPGQPVAMQGRDHGPQPLADIADDSGNVTSSAAGDELKRLAEERATEEARKHEFSSTQINLPPETSDAIKRLGAAIPDEHLAADGREETPHITLKYGLHGDDPEAVRKLLADEPPITATLGKTSILPNGESSSGDVVKVDVDSPDLHRLNRKIADALPHTDTHPDYKPHATVAYVKPGLGTQYAGDESLVGHTVTIDHVTFSDRDGKMFEIPLSGEREPTRTSSAAGDELKKLTQQHSKGAAEHELGPDAPAVRGRSTRVLLRDGQILPARYAVLDARDLQVSHDPFSFTPNPRYPESVQGRDYARNKSSQAAVATRALDFNADIALNPTESAGEGAPTILPDGTVLAGNERTMLARRAAVHAPERYAAYVEALKQRAGEFGIDPREIDAVEHPVLARVLTGDRDVAGGPKRWAEINRLSDEVTTKAKSSAEEGAARATTLQRATDALEHLGRTLEPEQTLNEYLATPDGRTFVRKLMQDGVITTAEYSRLSDARGALTEDGRLAIRRMLLSTAVTDPAVLHDAPAAAVAKIEPTVPSIVTTRGTPFDIANVTTDALRMLAEARDHGISVRDLESQASIFDDRPRSPHVTSLAEFIDENKPTAVKAAYRRYAALAREALGRTEVVDMFGGSGLDTPMDAFRDAFGIDENGDHTARSTSAESETHYAEVPRGGLFGDEPEPEPRQASMFGEREGTIHSRDLASTERAARSELAQLQQREPLERDPEKSAKIAQRIALLTKLLNRGDAIRPEELAARTRGEAERGRPTDETQGSLFAKIPLEQRRPGDAPTRAGQLLAEARNAAFDLPREGSPGKALGGTPEPTTPDVAVRGVNRFLDGYRRIFNVTARSGEAFTTGLIVREHDAGLVHRVERARTALMDFARSLDRLPVRDQLDFVDRMETGRDQRTPELTKAAAMIRQLLDEARDAIRALGEGHLEHWIENYFPHIWADPAKAQSVIAAMMGKRSLTGPGSFLKKRRIPTIREGIEAGLAPVTYNPIDLTLLKLQEMHKFLAGKRILAEMKDNNLLRFVSSFEKNPAGHAMIDDKISTVYGPPKVSVVEAFDYMVRSKLEAVMRELGVKHERRPNIGGGSNGGVRLGYAQGDRNITTRSATPESVIEHELGHTLDARLGLWKQLHDFPGDAKSKEAVAYRKAITTELRALADLRHEGIPADRVPQAQHEYVRSRPEKMANAVMGLIYAPERMREIAPTVMGRLREILRQDPTTAKILDIKPSFRHGADVFDVKTEGQVVLGHWFAPEPVANVVNNYLSPGISATAIGPFFDVYRGAGNILNMAQLGFSGFHLMFTSLDAAVSRNALGLLQLREGHPLDAAKSFATAPIAPITTAMKGFRVRRAYLRGTSDPVLAQIVDGLEAAGGRVKMDQFYGGSAWRQFRLALHEGASPGLSAGSRAAKFGTAAAKLLPATIEKSSAWLMQHVVPMQKLGVFYDLAHLELARLPAGADRMQVRAAMARAWDSVENRMGQLTYNNLFWHRWAKDAAMASVRSVGWNVGTFREIGGGAFDLAKSPLRNASGQRIALTPKASYVLALPVTVGLATGILGYLYTGQVPGSLKDWFYARTGKKNADGTDERVQLASYVRDVYDYANSPWRTIKGKVNPAAATVFDMLNNRDFFDNAIRNPHDPLVRQVGQEAHFIAKQFEPFGSRNFRDQRARGQSLATSAQNLVGITPAPRAVVRTPALDRMHEILGTRAPTGAMPEAIDERADVQKVRDALRAKEPGARQQLRSLAQSGSISTEDVKRILTDAARPAIVSQFDRLGLPDELEVLELANAEERRVWMPTVMQKLGKVRAGEYSPQQMAAIRQRLQAIRSSGRVKAAGGAR